MGTPAQAVAVQYSYQPLHFEGTTEKQDRYREFPIEKRAQRPPPPMRPTLHFDGARSALDPWSCRGVLPPLLLHKARVAACSRATLGQA